VENGLPQQTLLEQILDQGNMERAWSRVRANKGKPGIDGMSVKDFPAWSGSLCARSCRFARNSQVHIHRIIDQIGEGRYAPAPVKRVWIPKPDGTQRPLGVPTVLDRVIQQAIAQVLGPLFEVGFSESSFGFRYGRAAHAAVERISEASQEGYKWGVDCDLKGYWSSGFASFVSSLRSSERHRQSRPADPTAERARDGKARPATDRQIPSGGCPA